MPLRERFRHARLGRASLAVSQAKFPRFDTDSSRSRAKYVFVFYLVSFLNPIVPALMHKPAVNGKREFGGGGWLQFCAMEGHADRHEALSTFLRCVSRNWTPGPGAGR